MIQIKKVKTTPSSKPSFGVIDSLNSESTTDSLSANQGKKLNDKVDKATLECGYIPCSDMATYTIGGTTYKYANLVFKKKYDSPPIVLVSYYNTNKTFYGMVNVASGNTTTTGCELQFGANVNTTAIGINYVVVPIS